MRIDIDSKYSPHTRNEVILRSLSFKGVECAFNVGVNIQSPCFFESNK